MSSEPGAVESNGHRLVDADGISIEDVDNLGAVLDRLVRRVNHLEERVAELERDDRAARIEKVIDHADRLARGTKVALDYSEVMAAAGVSAPTAYSYMDHLEENHERVIGRTAPDGSRQILVVPPR